MSEYSLSFALQQWHDSPEGQNANASFFKNLSLALRQYVIPHLDSEAINLQIADFENYASKLRVERLKDAVAIFDEQFAEAVEKGLTKKDTGKNYRSALKRFVNWLEKQPWWQSLFPDSVVRVVPPRKKLQRKPKKNQEKRVRYTLDKDDLPTYLSQELASFKEFRLAGGANIPLDQIACRRRPRLEPAKESSTYKSNENQILYFLGWYAQAYPKSELHLELMTNIDLLDEFIDWIINIRDNRKANHATGITMVQVAIAIAKWLNYGRTKRKNWSDIQLIADLNSLRNEYKEEHRGEKKKSEIKYREDKEVSHEQAREIVEYLKDDCAPRNSRLNKKTGQRSFSRKRPFSVIARARQTHLLVKILVYCPVRQEEIRQWELGKTLFREVDDNGNPYYVVDLEPDSNKIKAERFYRLPSVLTQDLDLWIYKWRPLVNGAVATLEDWMTFWGYPLDIVERINRKIDNAKQGILDKRTKATPEEYIERQKEKLRGVERRLKAFPIAKENWSSHNCLFFVFGAKCTEAFGRPFNHNDFWITVRQATADATNNLYGEEKWINPHAFRNIAEKHIRQCGKSNIAEAFATLIGHSKRMGDQYAAKFTSEYEMTEDIVDDWWQ